MAQPMTKEIAHPGAGRRNPNAPRVYPEERARAAALERRLGRPLRLDIEGPRSDAESEEVILARLLDDDWMSGEDFLAKHGRG